MQLLLESNYLAPNAAFLAGVLVMLGLTVLLVVWPLVESALRGQWGYVLGIVLLGPIGGLVWLTKGRPETRRRVTAA